MPRSNVPEPIPDWVDPNKRTAAQELKDLGVTVEPLKRKANGEEVVWKEVKRTAPLTKPPADIEWIRKSAGRKSKIGGRISISNTAVCIGREALEKMGADEPITTLGLGVAPGPVLVIAINDPMGYAVRQDKAKTLICAGKKMVAKLTKAGLPCGRYKLDRQYDSLWTAVPDMVKEG